MKKHDLNLKPIPVPNEFKFADSAALAASLADSIAANLRIALVEHGRASLVVSGGRTPAPFQMALSGHELDWSKVWVTLADERWVDADHADSNEALVRRHLLRDRAVHARLVGLKNAAATPFQGEAECESSLLALPRPFDVVVLGMGDDGHTASLFPQAPQLAKALDMDSGRLCIGVDPVTAPYARMSLTLPALLASRRIAILFHGAAKYDVYRRALQAGPVEALPIRSVLHQHKVPVDVYWSL
jgi:6-phosphogluconolactonase